MNKKLYKIGYIIDKLKLTPRTIRYYDQLGLLPNVKRSDGLTRLFDDEDIKILKKINTLKNKSLSLKAIKQQLYPDTIHNNDIIVLTDSLTYNTNNQKNITCLNLDLDNMSQFIEDYKKLLNEKTTLFAVHQQSDLFKLPKEIKMLLSKKNVNLVEIPITGLLATPLVDLIIESMCKTKSITKTLITIKQHQNLLNAIGTSSVLKFHFQSTPTQTLKNSIITNKLNSFVPIIEQNPKTDLIVLRCEKDINRATTYLVNLLLEKMENRQNYANQIVIFDSTSDSKGKELQGTLANYYSSIPIKHAKINDINKKIFGPNSILISFL